MKKTTQSCFYTIIIVLLAAQYTYTGFNNAKILKANSHEINENELNNDRKIILS